MLRSLVISAVVVSAISSTEAAPLVSTEAAPLVSDFAFVMPEQWFLVPGAPHKDGTLQFRRFSVAMDKADFDSVRSGAKNRVQIIGQAGTFYNSMIYTCQRDTKKSDFLTFHFPSEISPASFQYSDAKPNLNLGLLADKKSTHVTAEYLKGDIFVDASTAGAETFIDLVTASTLTLDFGEKGDRLNLVVADKFATMDLSNATKEMLPILLNIKPQALRSFSNKQMLESCLQYKKH